MTPENTAPPTQKIHVVIAHAGVASRRKSEDLVAEGKVVVNGKVAQVGQRVNSVVDAISVEGVTIGSAATLVYYLLNKPVGIVSTTSDELGRPTVLTLVPKTSERLYPVGRLDIESEGLMILTNDGDFAYRYTHPKFEIEKTYHVEVAGEPTERALEHLRRGVRLKEGYTWPADVEALETNGENTWIAITIHQGWNRQVRRMLERVGYDTVRLIRVRIGEFELAQLAGKRVIEVKI